MKILIATNHSYMFYRFRKELVEALMQEHEVILSTPFVGHEDDLQAMDLRCIDTEIDRRSINPLKDIKLLKTYRKMLDEIQPELVITYSIKPNIYMRSIPKHATSLFACGKDAGDWMFGGAPFEIINNAIDVAVYAYNAEARSKIRAELELGDKLVIGHVGRFSPQKNHPFLLEIFAALLKKEPDAVLLLVGGGEDMPKMQVKAHALGIAEHVRFLGVRSDVADLMQAMDVFVFPSLYEGLPVTMVEAQAAGLPCVISDKVPPECILTDGLVDILPLSAEPETWAAKILEKKNFPRTDHRNEIAAHGFDITTEAIKLQEFYINAYEQNC